MPGVPGSRNRAKAAEWANQLKWALQNYEDSKRGIAAGQALRKIAVGVVEDALDKNAEFHWPAVQEIAMRLDGKPAQAVTVAGDDEGGPIRHALEVLFVEAASQVSGQASDPI